MNMPNADQIDYVNFNCWAWDGDNSTAFGLQNNFQQQWQKLEEQFQQVYQLTYDQLWPNVPFKNHSLDHELLHVSAYMNLVTETYSSDTTIALSEKTFRALCLPVPCMLYAGKHTVAYLTSLGFDMMHDVVEHRYDSMIENRTAAYGDKMVDFLFEGVEAVERMQARCPVDRAKQAAETNQQQLITMKQSWPKDFAAWWPTVLEKIQ
jgi:hypothetical protein